MHGVVDGRFELLAPLGAGSFSRVFKALDRETGLPCAIKLLDGKAPSDTASGRFGREIAALRAVRHPAIVQVLGHGIREEDGEPAPWIAMELLNGKLLTDWAVAARPGTGEPNYEGFAREACRLLAGVADALSAAHEAGVVHRDLSGQNVLITAETPVRARLFDFGLARLSDSDRLTRTGTVLGTAPSIAPEQVQGRTPGPPADVYSLGCVLFTTLTGRAPFVGDTLLEVLVGHMEKSVPDARAVDPRCPGGIARLLRNTLAKDPGARPQADAVAAALTSNETFS